MIIRLIAASHVIEIDNPKNFKAFSLRIEGALDAAAQTVLLGDIAVKCDRERAWISEPALRERPAPKSEAWWQDGLSGMIAAVQRFGWIDNESRAIQAQIGHVPRWRS